MGQLATFFEDLQTLHATIDPNLRAYRIRPRGQIDPPCVYATITDETFERMDTVHGQDELTVPVRLAVHRTDTEEEVDELLRFVDLYREVMDVALWTSDLPGDAEECRRMGMRQVVENFNGVDYLCVEFPIRVRLTRLIRTP